MRMRKLSALQCPLVRVLVPSLLIVVSFFCYANSAIATAEVSGNEVNTRGKLVNHELAKTKPEVHVEEAKLKGFFHPKPVVKKPFSKNAIPVVEIPIDFPHVPIPPKKGPPGLNTIASVKPFPKKPFFPPHTPEDKPESLLKPKPLFKKPIPKSPLHPKFKKALPPPLLVHKPIPTPP